MRQVLELVHLSKRSCLVGEQEHKTKKAGTDMLVLVPGGLAKAVSIAAQQQNLHSHIGLEIDA